MKNSKGKYKGIPCVEKCPTGINGLDDITDGGLPRGRTTLVCGGAGSGKTLLSMEFLVRGAQEFGENGVFMSFEESCDELAQNVGSLGFDIQDLIRSKKMAIDQVRVERSEIEETGDYDLEGLFVRMGSMIDGVGAKRVVVDSLESLFSSLPNETVLRSEIRRLFRYLKEKNVTVIVTGEQGPAGAVGLTRHGLEEYISDCVIFLDNRVANQVATRRLRIVKYRGSPHGMSEYPTVIDGNGLSVLPISALKLAYPVSNIRVSSGIPRLDRMLGGGYYKGSSILVSGSAGTGKTSIASAFANSICAKGGKCLYCSFEESPEQIMRNMRSIGFDLAKWHRKGDLQFHTVRPTMYGLETHLVKLHRLVSDFKPDAVVLDPVSNLAAVGDTDQVRSMLTRLIDYLKSSGVTALFNDLTSGDQANEMTNVGISSLMDSWLLLRTVESNNERNRMLYILKSRGMAHSNQMREFILSDKGLDLVDVYTGPGQVLTGAARLLQEARDRESEENELKEFERRGRAILEERTAIESQMRALKAKLDTLKDEDAYNARKESGRKKRNNNYKEEVSAHRQADIKGGR